VYRFGVFIAAVGGALAIAASAAAHAELSPAVALTNHGQFFTLAVPTEKDNATTTAIQLTVPSGVAIDSFQPSPGWKRSQQSTGSGESAFVNTVTWTGGSVPTQEDAVFGFSATLTGGSTTYTFGVRQTYSDGSVVEWNGPESSDTPSPVIEGVSSIGGGGGSSTLAIVAIVVAGVAVLLAAISLGSGRRPLT